MCKHAQIRIYETSASETCASRSVNKCYGALVRLRVTRVFASSVSAAAACYLETLKSTCSVVVHSSSTGKRSISGSVAAAAAEAANAASLISTNKRERHHGTCGRAAQDYRN